MMAYIIEHQDQLLLVLDGYDEYKDRDKITSDFHSAFPENAKIKMPVAALVSKLVSKSILRDSVILITSRSSQAVEIAETTHFDRYVEISGFSQPHFYEYVNKYFESKPEEIRNKAVNKVKGSQHYMSFGVIPLLCYLMCVVIELETRNQLTSDNLVIQTLTEFYSQVVNCVERNYNRAISSLGKNAASVAVTKTLNNFSRLSAQLLEQNRFSFTEGDLTNLTITEEELEYLKCSSLLSCTPVASNSLGETTYEYTFHHYTFQEFLACRYFVSINEIPAKLTDMSCVFMSGLMDPQRNARLMEELLQRVERQTRWDHEPTLLLLKCLEEYKDKEFVTRVLIECDRDTYWGGDDGVNLHGITDMDCSCAAMLIKTLTAASHELTTPPHELDIRGSSLTSSGLEVLMPALNINNCIITKMTLWNCKLDDECCKMIGLYLDYTNITELELPGNNIGDIGAACIAEHSSKLTNLRLTRNRITDRGVACIAEHCRTLTKLHLGDNGISDKGVAYIANQCNNLTGLYLNGNNITDKGAYCLAKHLQNLTKLNLSVNKITDSGVVCIAKHCSKLSKLQLSNNNITDTGVDCIAQHCSKLTDLGLSSNNITDTGVNCIVKHCGNLRWLNLRSNHISNECKERTRQFCKGNLDLWI